MNHKKRLLAVLILVALPSVAQANAGTPLMWAGLLHLLFGNFFIGILEGLLLAQIFGLQKGKSIGIFILANYFSAWFGGMYLREIIVRALPLDLYNAWFYFWVMVGITYIMTMVLEFPFIVWAFGRAPGWLRKSVLGSLIVQTASYTLLFGWYWLASGTSLYTETEVVPLAQMRLPEKVLVYFIAPEDGNVYVRSLPSPDKRKVFELKSRDLDDRLLVQRSSANRRKWDLVAYLGTDNGNTKIATIKEAFASIAAWSEREMASSSYRQGTASNFDNTAQLGNARQSSWEFRAGFWPIEGLRGSKNNFGIRVGFSFETPFGEWWVRNAIHLPGDTVLFQLGNNQICIYDPNTNRVALVTKGRGPVAAMAESEPEPTADTILK